MGEIADMMLDGTMDPETGEFNFDGEDGPGFPMTGAEAAAYERSMGRRHFRPDGLDKETRRALAIQGSAYKVTKAWRTKIEAFGTLRQNDAFHWQVRLAGKLIADWWPHRGKYRIDGKLHRGNEGDFVRALAKAAGAPA